MDSLVRKFVNGLKQKEVRGRKWVVQSELAGQVRVTEFAIDCAVAGATSLSGRTIAVLATRELAHQPSLLL